MADKLKTVVITGSNKGVGFGILQNLAAKPFKLIMACRSIERAQESRATVLKAHPTAQIDVLQLDVDSSSSIDQFVQNLSKTYGTIDVLLNNSGMAFKGDAFGPEVVETTFKTNFYGTVELTEKVLPFIAPSGKVIIVGSSIGKLKLVSNKETLSKYTDQKLTKQGLFELAKQFYEDVKDNTFAEKGWAKSAYGLSKLNINTYARVLSHYPEVLKNQIQVYTCCPGWVRTDMAGDKAPRSIEEGAVNPVYLVELPFVVNPQFQGQFFYDQVVVPL